MFHWALNTSLLLLRNYHFCTRPYYNISIKSAYTRILFDNPFHLYTDIDNVNPLSNLFPDSFQKLPSNLDNNIYKNIYKTIIMSKNRQNYLWYVFIYLFFPVLVNPILLLYGILKDFMKPIKPRDQHKSP